MVNRCGHTLEPRKVCREATREYRGRVSPMRYICTKHAQISRRTYRLKSITRFGNIGQPWPQPLLHNAHSLCRHVASFCETDESGCILSTLLRHSHSGSFCMHCTFWIYVISFTQYVLPQGTYRRGGALEQDFSERLLASALVFPHALALAAVYGHQQLL